MAAPQADFIPSSFSPATGNGSVPNLLIVTARLPTDYNSGAYSYYTVELLVRISLAVWLLALPDLCRLTPALCDRHPGTGMCQVWGAAPPSCP